MNSPKPVTPKVNPLEAEHEAKLRPKSEPYPAQKPPGFFYRQCTYCKRRMDDCECTGGESRRDH